MDSISIRVSNWALSYTINIFLVFLLFFCTVNSLTSFPIDKMFICVCPLMIALINTDRELFTAKEIFVLLIFTSVAIAASVMNIALHPMIFFPIIGLCFSLVIRKHKTLLLYSLYYALLIHIILGIVLVLLAFLGIGNFFVSAGAKGFTFLYAAHGLTSTVQTYGTLCITWLIIYSLRKTLGLNKTIDKFFLGIAFLGVALTFNRSTYLFCLLVLFFEFPYAFWGLVVLTSAILIRFWKVITEFVLSSASIDARSELLEGFNISWTHSNSIKVYLFGRGNNQIPEEIAQKVKWTTRTDLENGYAMLLHSYGIIGLATYISVCLYLIFLFLQKNKFKEAAFLFFYFFVTQYITQEFVSSTFYMFLGVMLLIYNSYSGTEKTHKTFAT